MNRSEWQKSDHEGTLPCGCKARFHAGSIEIMEKPWKTWDKGTHQVRERWCHIHRGDGTIGPGMTSAGFWDVVDSGTWTT